MNRPCNRCRGPVPARRAVCDDCARNRHLDRWKRRRQRLRPPRLIPGALEVFCWCQTEIVEAMPEEIKAGRTESCGRAGCHEGAA